MYKYCSLLIPYLMSLRLLPASPGFFFSLTSPTAQPEWLKVISDTEADIGSNLRWACAAAGKPRPMVRWLRNGEPLASQVGNRGSLPHHHPLLLAWPSSGWDNQEVLGCSAASSHLRVTWPQVGHLCSITEIWDSTKRGRDPKSGPQEA